MTTRLRRRRHVATRDPDKPTPGAPAPPEEAKQGDDAALSIGEQLVRSLNRAALESERDTPAPVEPPSPPAEPPKSSGQQFADALNKAVLEDKLTP